MLTFRAAALGGFLAVVGLIGTALAQSSDIPRTPWGHPDMQGLWNNSTTTSLEALTEEERARSREARRPVIEATAGTGAAFPEQRGPLDRPSLIIDPPDGRIKMTDKAIRRLIVRENAREGRGESDSWLDRNSWERCISRTLPVAMIPNLYNANYQIFQTPGHVVMLGEMIHDARVITLGDQPHAPSAIRQWHGDARGRWEGDTLVVETTNFSPQSGYRGAAENLNLVERFTLVGPDTLHYEITVTDPTTWTRPWTAMVPLSRSADPLFEYACHEGNIGMTGILAGARVEEAEASRGEQ